MSLHASYQSNLFYRLCKQKIQPKRRMNRVIVVSPVAERNNKPTSTKRLGLNSSVSSSDPTKSSLLRQPNTGVGIIGGVSADVTLDFVNKLVKWSNEGKDDGNGLPYVLCSDPILSNSCQLCNDTQIVEILRHKRAFLERSGACCIVIPCHISHLWFDEVSKGCSVPVLNMGECAANEFMEAKLKPIEAGSPVRIGVLATNAILNAGFYQDKLQKEGFEVILPDKATMEHTIIPSTEAKSRKDIEGAQNLLRIAIHVLLVRAVNTIILASDDLRDILPYDDPLLKKCVDPLDSLARPESGEKSIEVKQEGSPDTSQGGRGAEAVNIEKEQLMRFIVMGQKSLPDPSSKKKGRPYWGFVEMVTTNIQDIKDALKGEEYETKTRGHRHKPPARALGEGVYRILRHQHKKDKQMHTHLIYKLEFPSMEGEAAKQQPQEALNVAKEASFLLQIKNPTQKGRNEFRGLKRRRKPVFPKHLQERFGKLGYHAADPPDFLNYQGCEFLLISASDNIHEELGVDVHEDSSCSDLVNTFGAETSTDALLKGIWV
nr:probable amino-acid racemase [Tanacetum cinerariifolium]